VTQDEQALISAEMYWQEVFPQFKAPPQRFFVGWLRVMSLGELFSFFDYAAAQHSERPFTSVEFCVRFINLAIKDAKEARDHSEREADKEE